MSNATDSCVIHAGAAVVPAGATQKVERDVYIAVVGDRISAVSREPIPSARQLDRTECLVLPGFISAHSHVACAVPSRGVIERRRGNYMLALKVADTMSDDEFDAMSAYGLLELIISGCTTQVEMSLSVRQAESYVRVAAKFGSRGYPGAMFPRADRLYDIWRSSNGPLKVMSDRDFADYQIGTVKDAEEALAFARTFNHSSEDRIRTMMTPHATDTQTPETMSIARAGALELETGVHLHLAQSQEEEQSVLRRWGLRPVEWLDSLAVFDAPVIGAHMSGSNLLYDPGVLAKGHFLFAHCPFDVGVNGKLQPYPELLASGVPTGVGVDAHNMDFIETLKMAVIKGQARHGTTATPGVPSVRPTIEDAVFGATQGTADALGRTDLGRISVGAKADLTIVDTSTLFAGVGAIGPEPASNLLYSNGKCVRDVCIDGDWKVMDGEVLFGDIAEIRAGAANAAKAVWEKLDGYGYFGGTVPDLLREVPKERVIGS